MATGEAAAVRWLQQAMRNGDPWTAGHLIDSVCSAGCRTAVYADSADPLLQLVSALGQRQQLTVAAALRLRGSGAERQLLLLLQLPSGARVREAQLLIVRKLGLAPGAARVVCVHNGVALQEETPLRQLLLPDAADARCLRVSALLLPASCCLSISALLLPASCCSSPSGRCSGRRLDVGHSVAESRHRSHAEEPLAPWQRHRSHAEEPLAPWQPLSLSHAGWPVPGAADSDDSDCSSTAAVDVRCDEDAFFDRAMSVMRARSMALRSGSSAAAQRQM